MITTLKQARECSIEEFNKLLNYAYNNSLVLTINDKESFLNARITTLKCCYTYIYQVPNHSLIYIKLKKNNKYSLFVSNLNDTIVNGNMYKKLSILECIIKFQHKFNQKNKLCNYIDENNLIENDLSYVDTQSNKIISYVNNAGIIKSKQGNYDNFIEYDLKSAWLTFLAQDKLPYIPVDKNNKLELSKCYYKEPKLVGNNQIGFKLSYKDFIKQYEVVKSGNYANFIFDLVENKQQNKLLKYKEKINNTTDKITRRNLKNMANLWIGNLTHHNPFLRSYIIQCCNEYIENIIKKYKKYHIYSVTDSVAFTESIKELENNSLFSKKLSDYKLLVVDNNRFYYDNNGIIQKATMRGISCAKFIGEHIDNLKMCYNKPNKYKLSIINHKYKLMEEKL